MNPQGASRHIKLLRCGRDQVVCIPHDLELPGEDAVMRKEGGRLIIEPAPCQSLLRVLETLEPLREAFPLPRDPPPKPVDL